MSIFDGLGLDEIDPNPNAFPDGTYNAFLFEAKVVPLKDGSGKRLVLTYKLADGPHKGKTIDEWKSGINPNDDARAKAFLKQRILSLGVPEDKISSLNIEDLVGLEVRITKKQNGQYANVNNVVIGHATDGSVDAATSATNVDDLL